MSASSEGTLVCRGVVRRRGGDESDAATIDPQRCAGCPRWCGIRIGRTRMRFDLNDLPDGTPVEFVAAPRAFTSRALLVFGAPLVSAALAALVDASPWFVPAAFAGGLLVALGARFAWPSAKLDVEVQTVPRLVRLHLA